MPANTDKTAQEELRALRRRVAELEAKVAEQDRLAEELALTRLIVDQSPVILFRRRAGDYPRLVYVSDNIARLGYSPEELYSGDVNFKDLMHPADQERVSDEIARNADLDLDEYEQHYRLLTRDGQVRHVIDTTSVVRDASGKKLFNQGIVADITDSREAQLLLEQSEEKYRRIVETTGQGFVLMDKDLRIVDMNEAFRRMTGYSREELLGAAPIDLACEDYHDFLKANREDMLAQEYRSFELSIRTRGNRPLPVLINGNVLRDSSGRPQGNVAFVTNLTQQKKALALAAEVQKGLLPQRPLFLPGLEVSGRTISSEMVGGDYFDYMRSPDDRLSVAVGDISGHGVDASLLMTTARAFLRMRAALPGTPGQIISELNRHLAHDLFGSGRFMTLFFLTAAPGGAGLSWVRAGHDPALCYYPAGDRFEELWGQGLPLGVEPDEQYEEQAMASRGKDCVIAIGTDGVWESRSRQGEMFGKDRLRGLIRGNASRGADAILDAVYHELADFTRGAPPDDDVTLVVLKVAA